MGKNNKYSTSEYNIGTVRLIIIMIAILLHIIILALLVYRLKYNTIYLYTLMKGIGLIKVIKINGNGQTSPFTSLWTIIILLIPVFGELLYFFWGSIEIKGRKSKIMKAIVKESSELLFEDGFESLITKFDKPSSRKIHKYLLNEGFPAYDGTNSTYYESSKKYFISLIQELKNAQQFIFLEYHVIESGEIWDEIFEILCSKATEGIEVRLMYDDIGSLSISISMIKELKDAGVKVLCFNRVRHFWSKLYINYRNHQRIAVIDGHVAFTGGIDITTQYEYDDGSSNIWKDNGIKLEGNAVWSMTVIFLRLWELETEKKENYIYYKRNINVKGEGIYQPFSDDPFNNPKNPAKKMYQQMIQSAEKYVYITTPYLIIDIQMMDYLCTAVECGIDVKIVLPKVFDKKHLKKMSYINVKKLLEAGVKIYEYTPGYIHSKTIISDDEQVIMGTINMNYKSFYLNFENGVWIYNSPVIKKISEDIMKIFDKCNEIVIDEWVRYYKIGKIKEYFLRLVSPFF